MTAATPNPNMGWEQFADDHWSYYHALGATHHEVGIVRKSDGVWYWESTRASHAGDGRWRGFVPTLAEAKQRIEAIHLAARQVVQDRIDAKRERREQAVEQVEQAAVEYHRTRWQRRAIEWPVGLIRGVAIGSGFLLLGFMGAMNRGGNPSAAVEQVPGFGVFFGFLILMVVGWFVVLPSMAALIERVRA